MSRADKRYHTEHVLCSENDMTRVRLYAFANTRPSYSVCFAPERPLIVLKTQRSGNNYNNNKEYEQSKCKLSVNDHVNAHDDPETSKGNALAQEAMNACLQWKPLSSLVFERQPNTTHAVYVVDASSFCSTSSEKEEEINGAGVGEYLKSIRNVISRLNPHNGTLIAAGVSCFVAFKYMLVGEKEMGHTDRLLRLLLLVRPPPVAFFRQLVDAVRRLRAYQQSCKKQSGKINQAQPKSKVNTESTYPLFDICVLVSGNDVERQCNEWELFLHSLQTSSDLGDADNNNTTPLISSYKVSCEIAPSIFHAIAREANVLDEGISLDETKRFTEPRLYRIDFALSRYTKAIEQHVHLCSHLESEHRYHHHHHTHNYSHSHEHCTKCSTDKSCKPCSREEDKEEEKNKQSNRCEEMTQNVNIQEDLNGDNNGEEEEDDEEEEEWDSEIDNVDNDKNNDDNDECGSDIISTAFVKTNLSHLHNCTGAQRFSVEGRVIDLERNLFGTTDGVTCVSNLNELVAASNSLRKHIVCHAHKGAAVSIDGHLLRRHNGCVELRASNITVMSSHAEEASLTAALHKRELPLHYNLSEMAVACGGLIIRGRKCALVRSMKPIKQSSLSIDKTKTETSATKLQKLQEKQQEKFERLHIPFTNHNLSKEDAVQCAVRAICDQCDISSDNFYIPSYLPPIMMYEPNTTCSKENDKHKEEDRGEDNDVQEENIVCNDWQAKTKCVMLFIALAINPPPSGPESDFVEDAPEPDEPYDWVSYERALEILSHCPAEQEALKEMQRHLEHARTAGLYRPVKGCGMFGDAVIPLNHERQDHTLKKDCSSNTLERESKNITTIITTPKSVNEENKESKIVTQSSQCNLTGLEIIVIACPGLFIDTVTASTDKSTIEKCASNAYNQEKGMRTINSIITSAFNTKHIYVHNGQEMTDNDVDDECNSENNYEDSCKKANFDEIATSPSIKELISQAMQARNNNESNLVVLLNTCVIDVEEFCANELLYLTQECHASARVFTLLSQFAINTITQLTHVKDSKDTNTADSNASSCEDNDRIQSSESTLNSQKMRHELFAAAQLSDALFLLPELHGKEDNKECVSILQICKVVNTDIDIYKSFVLYHSIKVIPLNVENVDYNSINENDNCKTEHKDNSTCNKSNNKSGMQSANVKASLPSLSLSSSPAETIFGKDKETIQCDALSTSHPYLYCVTVSTSTSSKQNESIPVAPAALAYLTRPNSLKSFYRNDKMCLWWLHGILWIATRPNARAEVTLNCNAKCINADKGDAWEEHETRESIMHLYFWLEPGEELAVKTLAEQMMEQLCWNATRDGDDFTKLYDPLPEWV